MLLSARIVLLGMFGTSDFYTSDCRFTVLMLLQVLGVGAAVLGDMSSRPNWGLNELDFVFSTLIVGSIMNFALMYLLAPTGAKAGAALPKGLIAKLFDERTLTKMGAPGGHIFEKGFSMGGRAINLMYKTVMFGTIGFIAGLAGALRCFRLPLCTRLSLGLFLRVFHGSGSFYHTHEAMGRSLNTLERCRSAGGSV